MAKFKLSLFTVMNPVRDTARRVAKSAIQFLKPYRQAPAQGDITHPGRVPHTMDAMNIPREISLANPSFVPWAYIELMRIYPVVRMALVRMRSAIRSRRITLSGGIAEQRQFHQAWIDSFLPTIDSMIPEAMFYGSFFAAVDWGVDSQGRIVPVKMKTVDPFNVRILTDSNNDICGISSQGQELKSGRYFYLAWENFGNLLHGRGQHLSIYYIWYALCFVQVWEQRYLESGVDPIRIIHSDKVAIKTGKLNPDGTPNTISLARILRDAFSSAVGGAKITIPRNDEGENQADVDTLNLPDRSDIFAKAKQSLKQSLLESLYSLPGTGITSVYGDSKAVDAAIAEKTQTSIFQLFADMPVDEIDRLIAVSHKINQFEGDPPKASSTELSPVSKELFANVVKASLNEEMTYFDSETEETYRLRDMIDWEQTLDVLGVPREQNFKPGTINEVGPGVGGRPREPLSERGESRQRGNDR